MQKIFPVRVPIIQNKQVLFENFPFEIWYRDIIPKMSTLGVYKCELYLGRPVHSAPIRLWGSPMALKHTSAIAGAVSRLRLPVPALTEPNFRLSAPISSSGSESRTLVVEKQKVPVDLCHLIDLENFWEKSISWNCLKREIYTQKKLRRIYVMKWLSRSQSRGAGAEAENSAPWEP